MMCFLIVFMQGNQHFYLVDEKNTELFKEQFREGKNLSFTAVSEMDFTKERQVTWKYDSVTGYEIREADNKYQH